MCGLVFNPATKAAPGTAGTKLPVVKSSSTSIRRGARAVELDGLENRYARKRIEGSNPSLSANSVV
jgi:hypothetical protein